MTTIKQILGRGAVHPFSARMAPSIVLSALAAESRSLRVLDPMSGSGTALAVARAGGHQAYGFDLDPLAVLIARVWTQPLAHKQFLSRAQEVLEAARRTAASMHGGDAYPEDADEEVRTFVRYWFDLRARKQLAALGTHIRLADCSASVRRALWCAFSRLIITKSAGASLAADLSHGRPHLVFREAPRLPFAHFLEACLAVKDGTVAVSDHAKGPRAVIREGDARALPLRDSTIDLVVTSPPYMNAIDYFRCSKFSLVWMGPGLAELRELRSVSVGTEVGLPARQTRADVSRACGLACDGDLPPRQQAILARYVVDMDAVCAEAARVLVPGGRAVFVVGNSTVRGAYVRNSDIVGALAADRGFEPVAKEERELPPNRRYMPPPTGRGTNPMAKRMRTEVVMTFRRTGRRQTSERVQSPHSA